MKKLILFFVFLLLSFQVIALSEGEFGHGKFGDGFFGLANGSSSSNNDLVIKNNETVVVNSTATTDTFIKFQGNSQVSGKVTIIKSKIKPVNSTTPKSKNALNKFIQINVDSSIANSLNYSIITVNYNESEIGNTVESSIRLSKWNGSQWVEFDGVGLGWVNTNLNKVYANTTRFSTWGLFASPTPTTTTSTTTSSSGSSGGGSSSGGGGALIVNGLSKVTKDLTLKYAGAYQFRFEGEQHTLIIIKVYKEFIRLRLTSTPIYLDLYEGKIELIDLNGDGLKDLSLGLKKIIPYGGDFTISLVETVEETEEKTKNLDLGNATIYKQDVIEETESIVAINKIIDGTEDTIEEENNKPKNYIFVMFLSFLVVALIMGIVHIKKPKDKIGEVKTYVK